MILARVVWLDPPLIGARIFSRFLTRQTRALLPRFSERTHHFDSARHRQEKRSMSWHFVHCGSPRQLQTLERL
jgi:hypothetical protein